MYIYEHILKIETYKTICSHSLKIGRLRIIFKNFSTINMYSKKEYVSFKKGNVRNKFF